MIKEKLYAITLSYATFAVITDRYSQIVKDVAPIGKWAKGRNIARVLKYYTKRGGYISIHYIERYV